MWSSLNYQDNWSPKLEITRISYVITPVNKGWTIVAFYLPLLTPLIKICLLANRSEWSLQMLMVFDTFTSWQFESCSLNIVTSKKDFQKKLIIESQMSLLLVRYVIILLLEGNFLLYCLSERLNKCKLLCNLIRYTWRKQKHAHTQQFWKFRKFLLWSTHLQFFYYLSRM